MKNIRRKLIAILCCGLFFLMVYLNHTPPNDIYHVADYYVNSAFTETGATNIVTSVYLHYRYYDTIFEALMLLFSILAVMYLSVHKHKGDDHDE